MTEPRRYRLGDEIGRGALGRVVRVHSDDGIDRAGKILHVSHRADAKARARFEGEAKILGNLRHPNVVAVHGLEVIDGERVLVMELVDGISLASAIAMDAPMPPARIVAIGAGMAAGLAEAHHAGLIHRDLKPDNVLLAANDRPKLVDFGMARATSFAGVDPSAFAIVGTPDYMAPETIDPLAVDARSDLYSVGCILYEMAAGVPPYRGATAFAVLEAHRTAPIPALPDGCPRELADLIAALLAKSPADRPQSAAAVEAALARIGAAGALVPAADFAIVHDGRCAACGAPAVDGVAVCFGCGLAQAGIEPGGHTVFVVGPGEPADKLDSALRERLLDWLRASPALGLDPTTVTKQVPRLPFVLVSGVSARTGQTLVDTLRGLGLEAAAVTGGRFALPAMRKKAWRLGGRTVLIGTSGLWGGMHVLGPAMFPALGIAALGMTGLAWYNAGRPVVKRAKAAKAALPDAITAALERIAQAVPGIRERRHRESLRAVVQRVLATRDTVRDDARATMDPDLARVLDLALVAAVRIDELETELIATDSRDPTAESRRAMLERDAWAARLLELTAFLDVVRARLVAVDAAPNRDAAGDLDELRAHIEALEEVQTL